MIFFAVRFSSNSTYWQKDPSSGMYLKKSVFPLLSRRVACCNIVLCDDDGNWHGLRSFRSCEPCMTGLLCMCKAKLRDCITTGTFFSLSRALNAAALGIYVNDIFRCNMHKSTKPTVTPYPLHEHNSLTIFVINLRYNNSTTA